MSAPRATVVGCGLIGGSIGLALRARGWHVSGVDASDAITRRAQDLRAIDSIGPDPDADVTFVAVPVQAVAGLAAEALATTRGVVTDVGSVKGSVVDAVDDPRFVGGHPMAGSELDGVEGARPDLFEGAVWVLTPTPDTDQQAYARVRSVVSSFGADVVDLAPHRHDEFVAVVSHVPHLTAASLMRLAGARAEEHRALLRLAAGGFRDMTRIASGSPTIWPDICDENRDAILDSLDGLISALRHTREVVASGDRDRLVADLNEARLARRNLPGRYTKPSQLAEMRVRIPDRAGVLDVVTGAAAELSVSIVDIEIAHYAEGEQGVAIMVVEADSAETFAAALGERGFHAVIRRLD